MGKITKITTQQKNLERYNIFIDEKYAFSVDERVLISFNLQKGLEIDALMMSQIQYEDDIKKAFNSSLVFLSHRMRTEKEIRDYLLKKEYEEEIIPEVVHKLKEFGYLKDEEFASAFVNTMMATTDKGPGRVRQELAEKGVSKSIAEQVMNVFTREEELEKAIMVAEKTVKKNMKLSALQKKQKVDQTLMRKGYSPSIFKGVHEAISVENEEEENWTALYHQGLKIHKRYSSKYEGYDYVQRMKKALYQKGFGMEDIERLLDKLQEE
ncbi:recombination regulator RecX [Bacillus sp. 2205SS5-2]|uniref:recombination regulator RecX n=1 Tax=Bacillus sp. 2205SS5-2 TaxID=3109031 RepID=UPI0030064B3E